MHFEAPFIGQENIKLASVSNTPTVACAGFGKGGKLKVSGMEVPVWSRGRSPGRGSGGQSPPEAGALFLFFI